MRRFLHWLSSFFRTVIRSAYDVKAYRGIRHKPLREAVGYLAVLLAVFTVLPFMVFFFVGVRQALVAAHADIRGYVPVGTTFELRKGKLTSDLASPIVVRDGGDVFIVNDASSTMTLSASETGIVVTGDGSIMVKEDTTVAPHAIDLSSAPDAKTTRESMLDWLDHSAAWFVLMLSVLVLAAFSAMTAIRYGLSTALYGLVLWLFLKARKKPMPFRQVWVVSMYAATVMIVIGAAFEMLGIDAGLLPTAFYWIALAFIAYDFTKKEAPHEGSQDQGPHEGPR